MKKYALILTAIALLGIFGCVPKAPPAEPNSDDSLTVDVDTVAVLTGLAECQTLSNGEFCARGLDILKIGDSLVWNNNIVPSLDNAIMKDTLFEEAMAPELATAEDSTVAWFVKIMRFPDGDIYLEAGGENAHALNRIQIHSRFYKLKNGLHVGSTGKDLKAAYEDAYVVPFLEYNVMEVYVPYAEGRLFIHVPMEGIYSPAKEKYELSDIPDNVAIVRMVVM